MLVSIACVVVSMKYFLSWCARMLVRPSIVCENIVNRGDFVIESMRLSSVADALNICCMRRYAKESMINRTCVCVVCMCVYMYACICTCVYVCTYVCMCVCMYVCMYVCM